MAKPTHPATLRKDDLSNVGFEKALEDKVNQLLPEEECSLWKLKTAKKDSILKVIRDVRLKKNKRAKKAGPNSSLNQTCRSPQNYVNKGFLNYAKNLRKENLKIPQKDLPQTYHKEQHELFTKVANTFPDLFKYVVEKQDKNGLWNLYNNKGKKPGVLTSIKFVNLVDKITKLYILELSKPKSELERLDLPYLTECCQKIVMGRYLADILFDANLMDAEIRRWQNHAEIIISFSALLVILEMLVIKLSPKPKKKKQKVKIFGCFSFSAQY